jgi:hypothetical protein
MRAGCRKEKVHTLMFKGTNGKNESNKKRKTTQNM